MKKNIFMFGAILICLIAYSNAGSNISALGLDEVKEKKAIFQVIENETSCFFKRDYEGWKKNYVQTNYAFQAWNEESGTFDAKVGWNEVDEKIGQYIKANPLNSKYKSEHPRIERKNIITKFFGDDVAYLIWDQYNSDKQMLNYRHSKETRIMQKINGEWKIVNISAFWDYKNVIPADSLN
jgi:hypothetical protein